MVLNLTYLFPSPGPASGTKTPVVKNMSHFIKWMEILWIKLQG